MMQAERIWIATNLHGVAVKAFVEMTGDQSLIAFDLVRLWNNRADIIHVAELEGRYYTGVTCSTHTLGNHPNT